MVELKDEVDKPTITPERLMGGRTTQKISKDIEELKTTDHQNQNNIPKTHHLTRTEYTLRECPWCICQRKPHVGPYNKLNKFRIATIQSMFFNHKEIRLDINIRKIKEKSPHT